jgi:LuxR family maltose regulon positive regulatory protein
VSAPLLKTKFHIPLLRSEFVSRPHLLERLDEGLHPGCKLILISAPAGFGKTTLLSEWAGGVGQPVAWLSLDKGDNDLNRFFAYLLAALQRIDPQIGQTAQAILQAPQPPAPEALLTTVINDMADTAQPFTLVLDDYHHLEARPVHDTLAYLLQHSPPHVHLVLATRADPPLPIARLRGRGQLIGLYQADLRFTAEEAAEFLNRVMGLDLSVEDVTALEKRTEGWIAGLQMAAVSMRGRKDVSGFIKAFSGSHRFILDYLVEEVLEQQRGDVQEFLLKTSILERMTAPLCDLITDRDDSQSILESLEAANLFLVPLDEERCWYRYHQLFADLLRQLLQREARNLMPELHRRASKWYERSGLIPEAVSHVVVAGEFERAADLVEQTAWAMLTRGECTTLLGWLDALPDDLVRARPRLGVFRAWALAFAGRLDSVASCLAHVDVQHVRGEVAAVRAFVAGVRGDVRRTIEFAHQASENLPEENLFLRAIVALNLGAAYWLSGDLTAASRALTETIRLSRVADQTYLTMVATTTLGHIQEMQGLLHQATETHREALQLADASSSRPVPFAGMAHVGLAEVLHEWNDLENARRCALEGIRLSELGGRVSYVLAGNIILGRVCHAQGDVDGALEVIQTAERLAQRHGFAYMSAEVAELRARLWVRQGNTAAASQWAQEHRLTSVDEISLTLAHEMEQIAVARVLVTQGEHGEALELLAQLQEAAEAAGRMKNAIKILALQALAFQIQGDSEQALSALERALTLAEPEGYVRTFVDEGEPIARLVRRALSQGIALDYGARLLAAFGEEVELKPPAMESMVEPLTERELEVLRLIVAGLSNPEIAEELFIAVSTVKSHVNHIYGKLGVSNRVEAVTRAQSMGLL